MSKIFESSSTPERNANLDVGHKTPPVNSDLSAFKTEIEPSSSRFAPIYANTSEKAGVNLEALTPFAGTSDRTEGGSNEQYPDEQIGQEQIVREILAAEMGGATPGIPAFTIPSIPIRSRKSRTLSEVSNRSDAEVTDNPSAIVVIQDSEDKTKGVTLPNQEETQAVKDGSQKIPSATNEGPGDASHLKGKGKIDPIDKKVEKKRIAAKAKADLEAERIPAFLSGGTCEVFLSEAPVSQSVCVIPPASLPVNSDSAAIPPCRAVQTSLNVTQIPSPRAPSLTPLPRLASKLWKERDEARRRADDIASGSSARGARHSSRLERIRSYLIALHAQEEVKTQLCYRHGARMSLEKLVEAEYELPPGLLENYIKEEEEYLTKVASFDPLGDDTLFPTPSPPPTGHPLDVASQVPDGISEHGSFLSPQDNQDGDQV
ncbi:hypothetical protein AALP_AAs43016U000100 [Arabis alpina]|uniref:Uncharacterized protein n=1 Tax=Arabis alpina TaxID=50452 RepID=A0A087FYX3_ARAAL|nr:hypothetical protein AALP_AAs43016U000100 [Arabis alpina]